MSTVSIIILCYNQEKFIAETLQSVFGQSYGNIQVIVVDDCSTDDSRSIIHTQLAERPEVLFIANDRNLGNCAAFNRGLSMATGDFVVDLAGDDVLFPDSIANRVAFFQSLPDQVGVTYSNASYIDENGSFIKSHFSSDTKPPQGDIYRDLILTYFIAPPTMMFRRSVMLALGGYDESLAYEDFDFWVRSSREYQYAYQPEVQIKIRKHKASLSTRQYAVGDTQLRSTYLVCLKIEAMNRSKAEEDALVKRLRYEARQAFFSAKHKEAKLFLKLLKDYGEPGFLYWLLEILNDQKIDLRWLRTTYHWLFFSVFAPKSHFK